MCYYSEIPYFSNITSWRGRLGNQIVLGQENRQDKNFVTTWVWQRVVYWHIVFGFLIASYNFNNNEACTSYCIFDLKSISSIPLYSQKTVTMSAIRVFNTCLFEWCRICFHCLYCDESRFGHDQNFWKVLSNSLCWHFLCICKYFFPLVY